MATEGNFSLAEADFPESPHLMETPPPFPPDASVTPAASPDSRIPESDRSWCIGLHLSGFSGILLGFALAHILVPLVIWLIKRAEGSSIDATGKEVLNFQISYSIYGLIAGLLCWGSGILCVVLIGFVFLPFALLIAAAVFIAWLTFMIIAAVKTSNGEEYRYPATIRFLC